MRANARKLLGRNSGLASRQAVYETSDGLEVESVEQYEMTRRRVLFEDVILVTWHREIGWSFSLANAFIAAVFFGIAALIFAANGSLLTAGIVAAFGVPSLVLILIRVVVKVDVVSVFGRRSKAVIRFAWRKLRARDTYGHLCARTRQIQEQIAAENAEIIEPPPDEGPPAPPPGPILSTVNLP